MKPLEVWRAGRTVVESYGWTGLRLRTAFELKRRFGVFRTQSLEQASGFSQLPISWPFVADLRAIAMAVDASSALARADRVAAGEYQAFRHEWRPLPRSAHDWSVHPLTGFEYPVEPWPVVHHLAAGLDSAIGDVKDVWEPARFSWIFDLVRGYAVSRDERYAEAFWRYVESFIDGAPAFRGVQWTCGQETAIRALVCLWAESAFDHAAATTPVRRERLQQLLISSAERIDDALEYGVSQRNNHGISECAGLIALGARYRGVHSQALRWFRRGQYWMEHCIRDQFATDGWYAQHSFTYTRVALDQALVADRVMRSMTGRGLSESAVGRLRSAVRLLVEVHDSATGDVPNHGANDGALVLPISLRGYRDFRPAITAAASTFDVELPRTFQVNDEALAWLGGSVERRAETRPIAVVGSSGWVSARRGRMRVFARAATYSSRPSHIDPAHVDVWMDGQPVALDAGTFRYNAPAPWRNALSGIEVHNTISIPSMPPVQRGPRFLWLGWPKARVVACSLSPEGDHVIELLNQTWADRGVVHRRTIVVETDAVIVTDAIETIGPAIDVVLHWLVRDGATMPQVHAPHGATFERIRADEHGVFGWHAPVYARKFPATSLRVVARTASGGSLRFTTAFGTPAVRSEGGEVWTAERRTAHHVTADGRLGGR